MIAIGEITSPAVIVAMLVVAVVAEVVRFILGYSTQRGIRIGYAIMSIFTAFTLLPLWIDPDMYYESAMEEIGKTEYADSLMKLSNPVALVLLIVLCFLGGYLGTIIAEKLFKEKTMVEIGSNRAAA